MEGCGISGAGRENDDACLAEFQRRGFFVADCVECPLDEILPVAGAGKPGREVEEIINQFGPTVVKRIRYSYKPRHVVLLSSETWPLISVLRSSGLGDGLLLHQGGPLPWPTTELVSRSRFQEALADLLGKATSSGA